MDVNIDSPFFEDDSERNTQERLPDCLLMMRAAATGFVVDPDEQSSVGAAFVADAVAYALVAALSAVQLVRNCGRYRPWTVQKMLHLLLFLGTLGACCRLYSSALLAIVWSPNLSN